MKVAISSENNTIESLIDQRFGRCRYFLVIDTGDISKIEVVENQGAIQGHGAGIRAAQQMGELGVKAVITGNLGPNSAAILGKLGIISYRASGTVKDAIEAFINDKLEKIGEVAPSHFGMFQKEKSGGERIFFPLLNDNGLNSNISEHFGYAPFFGIYDVEKKELKIIENNLNHADQGKSPIDQIEETFNPTTIFAKGIGGRAMGIIEEKGIALKTGPYNTVKEIIENLEKLEDLTQNCGHESH